MEKSYQAVQAGHAVAQHIIEYPHLWKNEYLIYLQIDDLNKLCEWEWKLKRDGKEFSVFREPDINDEPTAIAVCDDGKMFKKLKLI